LVDAAPGTFRRFAPDLSAARFAAALARHPRTTARRINSLAAELAGIGAGTSTVAPAKRDRRFADPAWTQNPLLRRIMQAYLAATRTADQLVGDAALGWPDDARIRFLAQTGRVREVPLLIVPPTINKFYALDLAPGRSMVEYLVRGGQQVFVISWRNPDARHASWGLDSYVEQVLGALDAVQRVCRAGQERRSSSTTCAPICKQPAVFREPSRETRQRQGPHRARARRGDRRRRRAVRRAVRP